MRTPSEIYSVDRQLNDDGTVTYALTIQASDDAALLDAAIDAGLPFDEFIYDAIRRRINPQRHRTARPEHATEALMDRRATLPWRRPPPPLDNHEAHGWSVAGGNPHRLRSPERHSRS